MKKIIGIFILILLLFSITTPVNIVFASELSDSIIMRLTETHSNSDIEITVKLVTNTGVSGMTLELVYNNGYRMVKDKLLVNVRHKFYYITNKRNP